MSVYSIAIDPVDALLFGDNRSARAGMDHLQLDQDPAPITFFGAIGSCIWEWHREHGKRNENDDWPQGMLGDRVDEDVFRPGKARIAELLAYCFRDFEGRLWFHKPRHFLCEEANPDNEPKAYRPIELLTPKRAEKARWSSPYERVLLTKPEKEIEEPLLVSQRLLESILCGIEEPRKTLVPNRVAPLDRFYRREMRAGIAMENETGLVVTGRLFTRPYRRFRPVPPDHLREDDSTGFQAWFQCFGQEFALSSRVGLLGGDRGRATFRFKPLPSGVQPLQELRDAVAGAVSDSEGFLIYLLTPSIGGGQEIEIAGKKPIAAATGKPFFASGWNSLRGEPRPIHSLAPAGSVFFFDWPDGFKREEVVRDNWLASVSPIGKEIGYGRILTGIWK